MSIKAVTWAFEQKLDDPIAKLVLIAICDRFNPDVGYAWPSVQWLADVADCSHRTAQNKIKLLEELGFVVKSYVRDGNTNLANRYRLPSLEGGANGAGVQELVHEGGAACLHEGGEDSVHPNYRNDINNKDISISFSKCWDEAPKKIGKKAALRAYKTALKDTDADMLLEGIKAYSAKVKSEQTDAKYICHPVTWLNQGRWEDVELATTPKHENFGISQRWFPSTKDEFLSKYNAMPNYYEKSRPDIISLAKQKGWFDA